MDITVINSDNLPHNPVRQYEFWEENVLPKKFINILQEYNEIYIKNSNIIIRKEEEKRHSDRYYNGYWDMVHLTDYISVGFIINTCIYSKSLFIIKEKLLLTYDVKIINKFVNNPRNSSYTKHSMNSKTIDTSRCFVKDKFKRNNASFKVPLQKILTNLTHKWNPYIVWRRMTFDQRQEHLKTLIHIFILHDTIPI